MHDTTEGEPMHRTTEDDTITVGEFGVRFLVEAADSNGSASVF
jgi:predicted component of type VI protein secretion system